MFRTPITARLLALGASVAMTFSVVVLIADHALPTDSGAQLVVRAGAPTLVR